MLEMRKKSLGFSLIEVLGALAVGGIMTVGLSTVVTASMEDTKGQQAALYQAQVVAAANKYIGNNFNTLSAAINGNVPAVVTLDMLKAENLLPDGIGNTNAYGQTPCVLILKTSRQNASGATSTALNALVVTEGGTAIDDLELGSIAAKSGQGGGFISSAEPNVARGAYNSWNITAQTTPRLPNFLSRNCSGTRAGSGRLASALFFDGSEQLAADFLYRSAIPGQPELNEMRTPIAMSANALATAGSACGSRAALAIDSATRGLLTCGTDELWQAISTWKSPVQNYDDLPKTGDAIGDVRLVRSSSRAFAYNGSDWVALAVDQNDNLVLPGTLSAKTVQASGEVVSNGAITAQGDITSDKNIKGKVVHGDTVLARDWFQTPSLFINEFAAAGTPCNIHYTNPDGSSGIYWAIGTVVRDKDSGFLLICAGDRVFRYQNGQTTLP